MRRCSQTGSATARRAVPRLMRAGLPAAAPTVRLLLASVDWLQGARVESRCQRRARRPTPLLPESRGAPGGASPPATSSQFTAETESATRSFARMTSNCSAGSLEAGTALSAGASKRQPAAKRSASIFTTALRAFGRTRAQAMPAPFPWELRYPLGIEPTPSAGSSRSSRRRRL
jgi:hypothetical protein